MTLTKSEMNSYLWDVVKSHWFYANSYEVRFFRKKRDQLKDRLTAELNEYLCGKIQQSGSMYKGTAICKSYDVDLIVPFRKDVGTLKGMRKKLSDVISDMADESFSLKKIRGQKVSIGLFYKNFWGRKCSIDVVPGREYSIGSYKKTGSLSLYDSFKKTWTRTNIRAQKSALESGHPCTKELVKLFKIMKLTQQLRKPKSFFLEVMVTKALKNYPSSNRYDLASPLEHIMKFLIRNLPNMILVDPGNPKNNLTAQFSMTDRQKFIELIKKTLTALQKGQQRIKAYFPIHQG